MRDELFEECAPDASAMIESMRAHGYTLSTAIADLIDNSLAANCRNVWLQFIWEGPSSWISVTDDGAGMSESDLVNAMRLGSQSPVEERSPDDLGRFGLGLKTASFSQARRLTVVSRNKGKAESLRRWDLDHLARPDVRGWQLLQNPHSATGDRAHDLSSRGIESGTQVILEVLDRIVGANDGRALRPASEKRFVEEIVLVEKHLAMVFHRFLAAAGSKRVQIHINGRSIDAWDPFSQDHPATRLFPFGRFNVDETTVEFAEVEADGFVLPHRDRFDERDPANGQRMHREAGGPSGWNAHQGFYLYRNKRLIIAGDWLGLGPGSGGWKKEEHFKLARIRLDIPNSLDLHWQIDVKKSTALAPPALRSWLTSLAKTVREEAKKVYAHRGSYGKRPPVDKNGRAAIWITRKRSGGVFSYRIDRKNNVVKGLMGANAKSDSPEFETLLRLIEETVPVQKIWIDTHENEEGFAPPFDGESPKSLRKIILNCHRQLVENGMSAKRAWSELEGMPAFRTVDALAIIGLLKEGE